jgi:hypothetical protein
MTSESNSMMHLGEIIENGQKESDHGGSGADIKAPGDGYGGTSTGKGQDMFSGNEQAPATPRNNEPSTPSHEHSTPRQQTSQTPTTTQGLAPIYPYIPPAFYPVSMPFAPAPPPVGDPFLTGTASDPTHYRDASSLHDPIPDTRRNRGGVTEPFPEKLHRMLEQTEREGVTDIVSFFSHGRAFAIHKPRRFSQEIMPRFFKQTRLTSFQRQ